MLSVFVTVSDISSGFIETVAQNKTTHRSIGNFETALNNCIDAFDSFADRRPSENYFRILKPEILEEMAAIESIEELRVRRCGDKMITIVCKDV